MRMRSRPAMRTAPLRWSAGFFISALCLSRAAVCRLNVASFAFVDIGFSSGAAFRLGVRGYATRLSRPFLLEFHVQSSRFQVESQANETWNLELGTIWSPPGMAYRRPGAI